MRRVFFVVLVFGIALMGCGKKKDVSANLLQEPLSIEALSTASSSATKPASEVKSQETKPAVTADAATSEPMLESLPPQGPYKPTTNEVQTALANAGFYTGKVDGKVGPMTKKAVEEFQKANSLEADGKVGPKTWAMLSKHLSAEPATQPVEKTEVAKKKK